MADPIRAGFIGLGDMGAPMAANLIAGGVPTTLWARREETLAPYIGPSVRRAADPYVVGANADVVGICVFGDADVREVVLGDRGVLAGMAAGGVILIHSTIAVETAVGLAQTGAERGVSVLDAPVSGSGQRARDGQLAIMVGGDRTAFERALPMMRCYGTTIHHLGPIGSGQKMKVVNNVLGFSNLRLAWQAIKTVDALGLDRDAAIATMRASSGGSFNLDILADRLMREPDFCRHAVPMSQKDTSIFQKVCATAAIPRSVLDDMAEQSVEVLRELGDVR